MHNNLNSRHAEKFYDANMMVEDNDSSSSSSSDDEDTLRSSISGKKIRRKLGRSKADRAEEQRRKAMLHYLNAVRD